MKTIYKTWNLMSNEEQEEFIKSVQEDEEIEDYEEARDRAQYLQGEYFLDDFGDKYSNLSCNKLNDNEFEIQGVLGLWNGDHKIYPTRINTLTKAIYKCLGEADDFLIEEDRYGNLMVKSYHHDGVNRFVIKKVTPGGLRCVKFRKEVWGC